VEKTGQEGGEGRGGEIRIATRADPAFGAHLFRWLSRSFLPLPFLGYPEKPGSFDRRDLPEHQRRPEIGIEGPFCGQARPLISDVCLFSCRRDPDQEVGTFSCCSLPPAEG